MTYKGNDPFENKMRQKAKLSLAMKELEFAVEHAGDTDEELVEYIKRCRRDLGHTPHSNEVIGGKYITQRFGDWRRALRLGGMYLAGPAPQQRNRKIFKDELQMVKKAQAQEKRQQMAEKMAKRAAAEKKAKAAKAAYQEKKLAEKMARKAAAEQAEAVETVEAAKIS